MKKEFEVIIYLKDGSQIKTVENKIDYIDTGIWIFQSDYDIFVPYGSLDFLRRFN